MMTTPFGRMKQTIFSIRRRTPKKVRRDAVSVYRCKMDTWGAMPTWKSAIQQAWKPALRRSSAPRSGEDGRDIKPARFCELFAKLSRPSGAVERLLRGFASLCGDILLGAEGDRNHGQRAQERALKRTKEAGGPLSPALVRISPHFLVSGHAAAAPFRWGNKPFSERGLKRATARLGSLLLAFARLARSGSKRAGWAVWLTLARVSSHWLASARIPPSPRRGGRRAKIFLSRAGLRCD